MTSIALRLSIPSDLLYLTFLARNTQFIPMYNLTIMAAVVEQS
jgi:hypothetical protein